MVICLEQGANDLHMVQLMPFLLSRKGAKQSLRCSSPCVCLSVCLSTRTSQKQRVWTSRNFLYTLPLAVVQPPLTTTNMLYTSGMWMTSNTGAGH